MTMVFPLALTLLVLAAQNPAMTPPPLAEWPGAEIARGVAFQGDGSVSLEAGTLGVPVITFWRPILFNEDSKRPVAGRMDCRVVAIEGVFDEAAFDPNALHDAVAEPREAQGFRDMERLLDSSDTVRQLDVVGRRSNPRSHYVLSYILVRDGERMVDIRRNCTFIYGDAASKPDVLPYIYRYTKISYAFEPNDGSRVVGTPIKDARTSEEFEAALNARWRISISSGPGLPGSPGAGQFVADYRKVLQGIVDECELGETLLVQATDGVSVLAILNEPSADKVACIKQNEGPGLIFQDRGAVT